MNKAESSARSRIIQVLRERMCTVEDLAKELGVTENAIRAQVVLLQRDGLVESVGQMKGIRKPSLIYGPTPEIDLYFSKAYPSALAYLLDVLAEQMSQEEFWTVMKKLGQKFANSAPRPTGNLQDRVERAIRFYETLGALTKTEKKGKRLIIKSNGCPLGVAVGAHAGICVAIESLLNELIGVPIHQRCDRGKRPGCRFEVELFPRDEVSKM